MEGRREDDFMTLGSAAETQSARVEVEVVRGEGGSPSCQL